MANMRKYGMTRACVPNRDADKRRRNHKVVEWHTFCDWIEQLPYSEIITIGG